MHPSPYSAATAALSSRPRARSRARTRPRRKSASRFWRGNIVEPDVLTKIILVQHDGRTVYVAERATVAGQDRPWVEFRLDADTALKTQHIAACMSELGIDPADVPPPMPDVLEINGVIYRREI